MVRHAMRRKNIHIYIYIFVCAKQTCGHICVKCTYVCVYVHVREKAEKPAMKDIGEDN